MRDKIYKVGNCPICRQGELEIVQEIHSGKLIICCDECDAEWISPDDALASLKGSRNKFGKTQNATLQEIINLGWDKYLKSYK